MVVLSQDIVSKVSKIITGKILRSEESGYIDSNTPLLSSGLGLDSVAVLELVMEVENQFGIVFQDSDLSIDIFKTVGSLAEVVSQKLGASN